MLEALAAEAFVDVVPDCGRRNASRVPLRSEFANGTAERACYSFFQSS